MTDSVDSLMPEDEMSKAIFIEFIDESLDSLDGLDNQLIAFEQNASDFNAINAIFRPVHSIKGNATFFGMMKIKKLAHELESLLDMLRKGQKLLTPSLMSVLLKGFDELKSIFCRVRDGGPELEHPDALDNLLAEISAAEEEPATAVMVWPQLVDKLDKMFLKLRKQDKDLVNEVETLLSQLREQIPGLTSGTEAPSEKTDDATPVESSPRTEESSSSAPVPDPSRSSASSGKTMRISEEQLDDFLAYVGELVVVGEMFNHLHTQLGEDDRHNELFTQFRYVNETFGDLSSNLQRSIMALRRIPLKPVLNKAPRLARDVATRHGKEIEVLVEDNSVMVDKSIIDMIDAPLTHMVRNAADHGIEMPDEREAVGKPRQGTIWISAHDKPDSVCIEIVDDGVGLDVDALREKAAAMGLLPQDRKPSWDDIIQVLFAPGVSTSNEVTDISGRGVGMDVAKRAIEEQGGAIDVDSTRGKGSTFTITLNKSVSTQILSGFLVRVAENILVLPMDRIQESAQISKEDVTSIRGQGRCVQRHGKILPLLSLGQVLDLPVGISAEPTVVVVSVGDRQVALVVDELVGVQQVVVKPIEGIDGMLEGFSGGALMGNGTIALVLDLDSVNLTE